MKKLVLTMVIAGLAMVASAQKLTEFRFYNVSAGSVLDNDSSNIDGGTALIYLSDDSTIDFNSAIGLSESYGDDFLYAAQETGSGAFAGRLTLDYLTELDGEDNYQGYEAYLIVLDLDYDLFTSVGNVAIGTYYDITSLHGPLADPDAPSTPQTFNPGSLQTSTQVVPEPATAMLLAFGGGLAWLIRLKQRLG